MRDISEMVREFRTARGFDSSPLYTQLLGVVADDEALLSLAAHTRYGQPTFALFGAVHDLLLRGVTHPLADYYASVVGPAARPVDAAAGEHFARFCAEYREPIAATLRTRLVQTNHVQRALVIRLGLALLRRATPGPICVVEIGCSAGLNLRADRYAFEVDGATVGDPTSPVRIPVRIPVHPPLDGWTGVLLPDLGKVPSIADAVGIDLEPPDVADERDRAWLRALVWPENTHQAAQLDAALRVVAADPPRVVRGDVIEVGPGVAAALPRSMPRIVVHTATRIHVPSERRPAFDAAVAGFGADAPMLHLAVEDGHLVAPSGRSGLALTATDPTGTRVIAVVDGHLGWLEPLPAMRDVSIGGDNAASGATDFPTGVKQPVPEPQP